MIPEMKKKPWMKWYPSDWRGEPTLRMVSRPARSLWVDLIGLMWESPLIGYLYVNSRKPSEADLARIFGDRPEDLSALINELREAGVFSETDEGVIYSRKMVRDAEISQKGRDDVQKRGGSWSPGKKPAKASSAAKEPTRDPNSPPNRDPITNILEARNKTNSSSLVNEKVNKKEVNSEVVNAPTPKAKPQAPATGAVAENKISNREEINRRLAGLLGISVEQLYLRGGYANFVADFYKWKCDGCDPELDIWPTIAKLAAQGKTIRGPRYFHDAIIDARDMRLSCLPSQDEIRQRMEAQVFAFYDVGWWIEDLGPNPKQPGCKIPPDILQKFAPKNHAATH